MTRLTLALALSCLGSFGSGCAMNGVSYKPYGPLAYSARSQAAAMTGTLGKSKDIAERMQLPHLSLVERTAMRNEWRQEFTSQLGSDDYSVIGFVSGRGNAYANLDAMKSAMCDRAAKEGGDIVLFVRSGIDEQESSYTTPGYSTTKVQTQVQGGGNYAMGTSTGNTTYTPAQVHSETNYFPYADGVVLRYMPGLGENLATILSLSEDELKQLDSAWDEYVALPNPTEDGWHALREKLLEQFKQRTSVASP